MKPWKSIRNLSTITSTSWLQWGHGDEAVEEYPRYSSGCANSRRFNGATAMKPWKSGRPAAATGTGFWLQWGHGDEAVEEVGDRHLVLTGLQASMGPRR